MNLTKKLFSVSLVVVMSLGFTTGVFADTGDVTKTDDLDLTIKGAELGSGGLDLETSPIQSFGEITLKADPETYNTSFDHEFTVTDLRGTHEGWSLSVSASQFDSGTHRLPNGSLTLDGIDHIDRVGSGSGELPTTELTRQTIIDDGNVLVANAEVGTGMGIFDLFFNDDALGLTIDATTAKVGTYTSTLTWNLESTPDA